MVTACGEWSWEKYVVGISFVLLISSTDYTTDKVTLGSTQPQSDKSCLMQTNQDINTEPPCAACGPDMSL